MTRSARGVDGVMSASSARAPGPIDKSDAKKIPQPTSRTKTGCEDEEALEDASGVCKQDEYGSGSLSSQPASEGHNTSLSPREAGRSPMSMNRDMYNSRASRGDGQIHGVNNCSGVPLRAPKGAYSPEDFELRSLYGHGSYSEVTISSSCFLHLGASGNELESASACPACSRSGKLH